MAVSNTWYTTEVRRAEMIAGPYQWPLNESNPLSAGYLERLVYDDADEGDEVWCVDTICPDGEIPPEVRGTIPEIAAMGIQEHFLRILLGTHKVSVRPLYRLNAEWYQAGRWRYPGHGVYEWWDDTERSTYIESAAAAVLRIHTGNSHG